METAVCLSQLNARPAAAQSSTRVDGRLLGLQRLARRLARLVSLNELDQHRHRGQPFRMAFLTISRATTFRGVKQSP
jgi:hypothetical protein